MKDWEISVKDIGLLSVHVTIDVIIRNDWWRSILSLNDVNAIIKDVLKIIRRLL